MIEHIQKKHYSVLIIGAGPAGLTAGYLLAKNNRSSIVIESTNMVGGISRTPKYKDFYFDIGGHRFFSKSDIIERLWDEMLPNQLLTRPRTSRIYYNKKFYHYPIKPFNALKQLGLLEASRCVFSYVRAKTKPSPVKSFADWIINQFGNRLYLHFFKTYTEKVWGMSCESISADWAAQRIQKLSLGNAIINAFIPAKIRKRKKAFIKSLTDTFRYPPCGPGMLWESCAEKYEAMGGVVLKNATVNLCTYAQENQTWNIQFMHADNQMEHITCDQLISSAPIKNLVCDFLSPKLSSSCLHAAQQLQYRDFLIVVLILHDKNLFTDNWIYIHDKDVDVGRIQNFKAWSPDMVPDMTLCSYGLEYFCNENDSLWNLSDADLIKKGSDELVKIGLAAQNDIIDGCVVRQRKAYPVYDHTYQENLNIIQAELKQKLPNLHLIGRNGLHKYNNQDHSMMTAMMTVQNILSKKTLYDVWQVNQDDEYHEKNTNNTIDLKTGLRDTPQRIREQ